MTPMLDHIDHLVLTITDITMARRFWCKGLGMTEERFGDDRIAFKFGRHKLNIHLADAAAINPRARHPVPGSADLCFISQNSLEQIASHMDSVGFACELGPIRRTGATGPLMSLYFRDPEGNLVEVSNQLDAMTGQVD